MKTVRFTKAHKFSTDDGLSTLSVEADDVKDVSDKLAERLVNRNVAEIVDPDDSEVSGEGSEYSEDPEGSDADETSEAATTGDEDGKTAEDPAGADDGSELADDDQDQADEGWPGKGKPEADENKAVNPGADK